MEPVSTKAVTFPYDGALEKLDVETGGQVKAGDVLAEYDADALDDGMDAMNVNRGCASAQHSSEVLRSAYSYGNSDPHARSTHCLKIVHFSSS